MKRAATMASLLSPSRRSPRELQKEAAQVSMELEEMLDNRTLRRVEDATLKRAPTGTIRDYVPIMAAYGMFVVWMAFVVTYLLLFGLYHGETVILDFVGTFWISQAISLLFFQPLFLLAMTVFSVVVGPVLTVWCGWCPLVSSRGGGSRGVLSGRLEHVSFVQAAGAASGLPPLESMLAFGVAGALTSALSLSTLRLQRRRDAQRAVAQQSRPDTAPAVPASVEHAPHPADDAADAGEEGEKAGGAALPPVTTTAAATAAVSWHSAGLAMPGEAYTGAKDEEAGEGDDSEDDGVAVADDVDFAGTDAPAAPPPEIATEAPGEMRLEESLVREYILYRYKRALRSLRESHGEETVDRVRSRVSRLVDALHRHISAESAGAGAAGAAPPMIRMSTDVQVDSILSRSRFRQGLLPPQLAEQLARLRGYALHEMHSTPAATPMAADGGADSSSPSSERKEDPEEETAHEGPAEEDGAGAGAGPDAEEVSKAVVGGVADVEGGAAESTSALLSSAEGVGFALDVDEAAEDMLDTLYGFNE